MKNRKYAEILIENLISSALEQMNLPTSKAKQIIRLSAKVSISEQLKKLNFPVRKINELVRLIYEDINKKDGKFWYSEEELVSEFNLK